jgi:hypothetical protein
MNEKLSNGEFLADVVKKWLRLNSKKLITCLKLKLIIEKLAFILVFF